MIPKQKMILCAAVSLFIFGIAKNSLAAPSVSNISGTVSHGSQITINGAEFGTKSPAPPVWWDDGEGAIIDQGPLSLTNVELSWATSSTLSGNSKHYGQVGPNSVTENFGYSNTQYRNASFRNLGSPHSHSAKIIAGCHDDEGECLGNEVGQNVGVGFAPNDGRHSKWFVHYYMRLDSLWPNLNSAVNENYKTFNWNTDINNCGGLYSNTWGFLYEVIGGCNNLYNSQAQSPKCRADYITAGGASGGTPQQIIDFNECSAYASGTYGYPVVSFSTATKNPVFQWIKEERLLDVPDDLFVWKINNIDSINTKNIETCGLNNDRIGEGICGVTIGGFWKGAECGGGQDDLDDNACRAFDDIYIDTTFSRIILANNQNYNQATITEPQIPSAWNGSSITADVNLGKLSDSGTAYLFIFDADNNHNATGYSVTIGSGSSDTTAPNAPSGLSVR